MLDAAFKALTQMFTRPFRAILWKSIGLALILIILLGVGLERLLVWLALLGEDWAQDALGMTTRTPLTILAWILSIAAGVGIVAGSIFLMPAVTAVVASFFADDIALEVERTHYADEPPGQALPLWRALAEGVKTALLTILIYIFALPFVLFAGLGAVAFFLATAFLLGREYFLLAAMRYRSPAEARALRKENGSTVFFGGMFIAGFAMVPILNLATPLFGAAFMVHMHKRLPAPKPMILKS